MIFNEFLSIEVTVDTKAVTGGRVLPEWKTMEVATIP